ncbi:hypothetical protein P691DRAFT_788735 [Macrolepiota fuliginosa MF-IS2]|uniref:Uncharacterized protein n=1 Tax=Macrolepiota fuliginosa MF-IS2 TaxID=1400762 RepID=A0A9P6C9R4_9AGAR|nr:hypothetical protein P691DRAFT_788735 [Macrolepiota fuliginosa MF-IS2]
MRLNNRMVRSGIALQLGLGLLLVSEKNIWTSAPGGVHNYPDGPPLLYGAVAHTVGGCEEGDSYLAVSTTARDTVDQTRWFSSAPDENILVIYRRQWSLDKGPEDVLRYS